MRKATFLALMMALVALCTTAMGLSIDDIAPLYDQREEGSVFVGTVIAAGDGYYVSGGMEGVDFLQPYIITEKGAYFVSHLQQFTNGMSLFTTTSEQEAAPVSTKEAKGTVVLASCNQSGLQLLNGRILYPMTWRNAPCCLLESSGEASMGAAVYDKDNGLLGVIVAAWGEGVNRYVMLPASSFMDAEGDLTPPAPTTTPAPENTVFVQWLKDGKAELSGHMLTVSWNQTALENPQEDSVVTVFLADEGNSYYSWIYAKAADGQLFAPVVPGRTYRYAVQHAYGETVSGLNWVDQAQQITVPAAADFTQYHYADASIYLGVLPAMVEGFSTAEAEKVENITRELLEDEGKSLMLQVTSTYQVTEEITCDMLLTLSTPDGNVFCEPASYIFMPDIMEKDVWNANLDGLLEDYLKLKKRFEPGEYVIRYYFDGALVNTVRFTLD